jgi:hypothetical protein
MYSTGFGCGMPVMGGSLYGGSYYGAPVTETIITE